MAIRAQPAYLCHFIFWIIYLGRYTPGRYVCALTMAPPGFMQHIADRDA